jgi:hypothetical protein
VFLLGVLGFFFLPLAIAAWIMGTKDLDAMKEGLMDQAGYKETETGAILGGFGTVLGIVGAAILVTIIATQTAEVQKQSNEVRSILRSLP